MPQILNIGDDEKNQDLERGFSVNFHDRQPENYVSSFLQNGGKSEERARLIPARQELSQLII